MADRIVILRDGVIEQAGTPMEVYGNPANQFVAGFIGAPTMNFFKGIVGNSGDAGTAINLDGGERLHVSRKLDSGRAVVVGIRPEHLVLNDAPTRFTGRVALVEPTGPSDYLLVKTGAGMATAVAPSAAAPIDAEVTLCADETHVHLFDEDSGISLSG